jgi:putative effector of murein hydrolase
MILLTLAAFTLSLWLYKKTKLSILHPLLPSVLVIITVLNLCGIDYNTYNNGVFIIDFMLGPSVVALGLELYEQRYYIKQNWLSMLTAIIVGSIVGVLSVAGIALLMNPSVELTMTLFPKSVTSPIAIDISRELGGIPSLSAVIVISAGIFGGLVGPFVLKALGITSRIAKG